LGLGMGMGLGKLKPMFSLMLEAINFPMLPVVFVVVAVVVDDDAADEHMKP